MSAASQASIQATGWVEGRIGLSVRGLVSECSGGKLRWVMDDLTFASAHLPILGHHPGGCLHGYVSGCWASGLWIHSQETSGQEERVGSFVTGTLPARVAGLILQNHHSFWGAPSTHSCPFRMLVTPG